MAKNAARWIAAGITDMARLTCRRMRRYFLKNAKVMNPLNEDQVVPFWILPFLAVRLLTQIAPSRYPLAPDS